MAGLASYSDLQTAVGDWLKDPSLSAQTDVFIALVEAQFNRRLRTTEMEAFTSLTTATSTVDLPADFLGVRAIWTGEYLPLEPLTIYELQRSFGAVTESVEARYFTGYTVVGPQILLGMTPAESTDFSFHYYQKIPPLTADSPVNWLLSSHPDVYFYGALLMAEGRGWNDERIPLFQAAFDSAIDAIMTAGIKKSYGGGPLIPRTNIAPLRRGRL